MSTSSSPRTAPVLSVVPVDWLATAVPDTPFLIYLPPDYEPRNAYGCYFARTGDNPYAPGWRDLCLDVASVEDSDAFDFAAVNDSTQTFALAGWVCSDCRTYRNIRTEQTVLGGRAAIVQRGLMTGGIEHAVDRPRMLIRIPLDADSIAVFHCQVGGPDDEAELLRIAATLAVRD